MPYTELLSVTAGLAVLSFLYYVVADKFNIIDKPNHRSSHTKPIIRGGGIVFVFGLLIYFFLNGFPYPYFVAGTALIAIVSFTDDLVTLRAHIRWPFQMLAVFLILYQVGLDNFPVWTYLPVLILALGFINFYNFMDGINGITGSSALVVLGAFYFLNQTYGVVDDMLLIYLMISVLVFGFFNFRKKALMFAGDIGSVSMAIMLLYIGIKLTIETQSAMIIMLYTIYGADSTLTIFFRIYKREKISNPHRHHIYQKLVDNFGLSHLLVSSLYAILQILLSIVSIYILFHVDVKYHFVIGFGISQVLTVFYIYLFRKNERRIKQS